MIVVYGLATFTGVAFVLAIMPDYPSPAPKKFRLIPQKIRGILENRRTNRDESTT